MFLFLFSFITLVSAGVSSYASGETSQEFVLPDPIHDEAQFLGSIHCDNGETSLYIFEKVSLADQPGYLFVEIWVPGGVVYYAVRNYADQRELYFVRQAITGEILSITQDIFNQALDAAAPDYMASFRDLPNTCLYNFPES